jgi:hypothetical protein
LKQRNVHPIGILKPHVGIAPRGHHGRVDEGRAVGERLVHRRVQVRHLQGDMEIKEKLSVNRLCESEPEVKRQDIV